MSTGAIIGIIVAVFVVAFLLVKVLGGKQKSSEAPAAKKSAAPKQPKKQESVDVADILRKFPDQ